MEIYFLACIVRDATGVRPFGVRDVIQTTREPRGKNTRHIGYLPQSPRFYNNYTIQEFLLYMAAVKGMDKKAARERCSTLLEFVNPGGREEKENRFLLRGDEAARGHCAGHA